MHLSQPLDKLNLVGRLMATLHWFLTACWWKPLTRKYQSIELRFSLHAACGNLSLAMSLFPNENCAVISIINIQSDLC